LTNTPIRVIIAEWKKYKPHYFLKAIQAQMGSPEAMNLTLSALAGIRSTGLSQADALTAIQGLSTADYYKSMTTNADHRVWQDVYHTEWHETGLYIKFQQMGEYFVISFILETAVEQGMWCVYWLAQQGARKQNSHSIQ
jgi:motility quorum-sensing regulator/GCU-specific mRNA interferase toxin